MPRFRRPFPLLFGLSLCAAAPSFAQSTLPTEREYDKHSQIYNGSSCAQITDTLPPIEAAPDDKVRVRADHADLLHNGLSTLSGSVKLKRDDQEITAEQLDYDELQQRITIDHESLFRSSKIVVDSQSSQFDLDDKSGLFNDDSFVVLMRGARGHADQLQVNADKTATLKGADYTTCAPGNNSWYLEASKIDLDYDAGIGTARNARLRFLDVPIFYSPWIQFPIDDRRRTGLLYPLLANTNKTGFDLREPLYINLAPNYDMTFTPRYMSERGTQLELSGRYLLSQSEGDLGYQYLNRDRVTDQERSYLYYNDRSLLTPRLSMDLHYADVSDPGYFEDLGNNGIDLSANSFLDRSARFMYQSPASYSVQMLVQDYQEITSNLTQVEQPYKRLPQILFNTQTRNSFLYSRLGLNGEYSNFVRADSVEGQRIDVDPYIKVERDTIAWYSKALLDYRYTDYRLTGTAPGDASNPSRGLPMLSTEYGLRFERLLDDGTPQLLEPRLFYLYVPYRNQDDLPVFDSGEPDFDFTQLFARNRFSGIDRISDANELTLALTGRQLDPDTGAVKASASIGQLYRLEAPRVALPGETPPDSGVTDLIGEFEYNLSTHWGTRLLAQWSPAESEISRAGVAVRYRDDNRHLFETAYRYRRGLLEQTDLTAMTPIYHAISLAGRWRYSVRDKQSLDTYVGLRYDTCCWAADAAFRRYISDSKGTMNNGIYFQLELKGLGQIGSGFPNLHVDDDVY
ncbi:LPS-assembly protein LptD [Solimonas terrae]|uniref:LPS-assembly protein LptD n=1 Tax=Solimonas terrae TaxID=1396819 RepID=UPI001F508D88|nr:LPS assembly protein LptD [Solimonas terrae]